MAAFKDSVYVAGYTDEGKKLNLKSQEPNSNDPNKNIRNSLPKGTQICVPYPGRALRFYLFWSLVLGAYLEFAAWVLVLFYLTLNRTPYTLHRDLF
jgi:hypothetical protein